MLSRVADNIYWMSRYLERAEHSIRVLAVALNTIPEQEAQQVHHILHRLQTALYMRPIEKVQMENFMVNVMENVENKTSVFSCIADARENARQVRELISSEMWEQINRLYLITLAAKEEGWKKDPEQLLRRLREGIHLFNGLTKDTMNYEQGFYFLEIGKSLERIQATANLLKAYYQDFVNAHHDKSEHPFEFANFMDFMEWLALLKSCTAYEAYCKVYTADIKMISVAEFLVLNPSSPRAIRFCADKVQVALQEIALSTGRNIRSLDQMAGRLQSSLQFVQIEDVLASGLTGFLGQIQNQCAQIHDILTQSYIQYPIEKELMI